MDTLEEEYRKEAAELLKEKREELRKLQTERSKIATLAKVQQRLDEIGSPKASKVTRLLNEEEQKAAKLEDLKKMKRRKLSPSVIASSATSQVEKERPTKASKTRPTRKPSGRRHFVMARPSPVCFLFSEVSERRAKSSRLSSEVPWHHMRKDALGRPFFVSQTRHLPGPAANPIGRPFR